MTASKWDPSFMSEESKYDPTAVLEARLLAWLIGSSFATGFSERQLLDRVDEHKCPDVYGAIRSLKRRGIVTDGPYGTFIVSQVAVESGAEVKAELWLSKVAEAVEAASERRAIRHEKYFKSPKKRDPSTQGWMPPSWRGERPWRGDRSRAREAT